MKQIIVVRGDLEMSPGKLAVQVSHASQEFLFAMIRNGEMNKYKRIEAGVKYINPEHRKISDTLEEEGLKRTLVDMNPDEYRTNFSIEKKLYDDWICGDHIKIVCRAKNKTRLKKLYEYAEELGVRHQLFAVYDKCYTELTPEEHDGTVLTCVATAPLPDDIAHELSKHYQLYK